MLYWSTVFYIVPNRVLSSSAISSAKMQVFNLMVSSGLRIADPVALIQGKVSQKTQQNTPLSQQMFFLQGTEF